MSHLVTPVTDRKIRFGFVGCGRISNKNFEALEQHAGDIDVVAVCDIVEERETANGHYDRVNYFLLGLGTLWAVAVSDAYITGVDATTINVDAAASGSAAAISLSGSF